MAEATYAIKSQNPVGARKPNAETQSYNAAGPWTLVPDARSFAAPGKTVKIYNVLPLEHKVNRANPYSNVTIPACPEGATVSPAFEIPQYVNVPESKMGSYEIRYNSSDGRAVAADICNPALGPNWNLPNAQDMDTSSDLSNVDNNLNAYGVFWTLLTPDEPGFNELVTKAKARAKKTLSGLLDKAKQKEASGKVSEITDTMRFAAKYFNLRTSYNQVYEHLVTCPNCGEGIPENVAYHRNQFGDKCILDWKRAFEVGAVKKDDVPESKRWWSDTPAVASEETEPQTPLEAGKKWFERTKS